MSERIRIEHFEAEDVRAIIEQYRSDRQDTCGYTRGDYLAEDLVNRIGEIYESALARKGQYLPR